MLADVFRAFSSLELSRVIVELNALAPRAGSRKELSSDTACGDSF